MSSKSLADHGGPDVVAHDIDVVVGSRGHVRADAVAVALGLHVHRGIAILNGTEAVATTLLNTVELVAVLALCQGDGVGQTRLLGEGEVVVAQLLDVHKIQFTRLHDVRAVVQAVLVDIGKIARACTTLADEACVAITGLRDVSSGVRDDVLFSGGQV